MRGIAVEESSENKRIDPQAITVSNASKLLSAMGFGSITDEMLTIDLEAGAPTNADGTVNLIHYAAWLIKERSRGD